MMARSIRRGVDVRKAIRADPMTEEEIALKFRRLAVM